MDYEAALAAAVELLARFPEDFEPDKAFAADLHYASFLSLFRDGPEKFIPQTLARWGNDPDCKLAALRVAGEAMESGKMPFDAVRAYVAPFLKTGAKIPGRPGKHHPMINWQRDIHIAMAIDKVVREYGFKATRNEASDHPSACSIVSDALRALDVDLKESAIVDIWGRLQRLRTT
jgi:hypothetical protein